MKKLFTVLSVLFVFALVPQFAQAQTDVKPAKKETVKKAEKVTKTKRMEKSETTKVKKSTKKNQGQPIKKEAKQEVRKKSTTRTKIPRPSKDKPVQAVVKPINKNKKAPERVTRKKD